MANENLTYYGKKYDTKAELIAAQKKGVSTTGKAKKQTAFFDKFIKGNKAKKDESAKASEAQGKANAGATKKMYAAESMFKSAKNREDASVMPGKARPFGVAFKSAKDSGKSSFLWRGNPYSTKTKSELESGSKLGKFKKRFDQTGNDESKKKESVLGKFKSSKTGSEFFSKLKKKK
jgi:hypothetical protein